MSWTNLETIGWGTQPTINCNFQYDRRRNGSAMEYNVWVGVNSTRTSLYFGYPIYCDIKVNGTTVKSVTLKNASPSNWSDRLEVYSGWTTVANKTSGTTSVSIRLYSGGGSTRDNTYSYTMAVDPAGSALSVSGTKTLGEAQTLTLTRYIDDFTDSISWEVVGGSNSGTIATKSSGTSFAFTPALSLATDAPSMSWLMIRYTVDTYNGNTLVQSQTFTYRYTIPDTVIPTAALAISDANNYATTYGGYVQTKSQLLMQITATQAYGSPISAYSATADGTTYNTQNTTTTPLLTAGADQAAVATVTDARGRTSAPATQTYTVLAYTAPQLSKLTVTRCQADGTADPTGHYGKAVFTAAVTALNNINSATYKLRYKKTSVNTWTETTLSTYTDTYAVTDGYGIFAADDDSTYDVQIQVTDDFGSVALQDGIPVAFAIMNWNEDGDGMAIGGINTQTGLQIYMDTEIYGDVDFQGTLSENGTALFPLSLSNGGTGGITAYSNSMTSSSESADIKTWTATVSGSGFVFARIACVCDTTNSWGTWNAEVMLNNVIRAKNLNRFGSNQMLAFSATASDFMQISNGDTIKLTGGATKSGTKTISYSIVALGCTVSVA